MDIVLSECFHGIPLVDGKGCVICSNRIPGNNICIKVAHGERITTTMRKLSALKGDAVEEISAALYI